MPEIKPDKPDSNLAMGNFVLYVCWIRAYENLAVWEENLMKRFFEKSQKI